MERIVERCHVLRRGYVRVCKRALTARVCTARVRHSIHLFPRFGLRTPKWVFRVQRSLAVETPEEKPKVENGSRAQSRLARLEAAAT